MANKKVVTCPVGHTRVWKKGTVPTRSGPKVRYVCVTCGRSWSAGTAKPVASAKSKKSKGSR